MEFAGQSSWFKWQARCQRVTLLLFNVQKSPAAKKMSSLAGRISRIFNVYIGAYCNNTIRGLVEAAYPVSLQISICEARNPNGS